MASIPIIQDRQNLVTDTGRQRISADADAFGGAQARGLKAIAGGLDSAAKAAETIDTRMDEADAADLDNQLNAAIRTSLWDPTQGYFFTSKGKEALDRRQSVQETLQQRADEIGGRARSKRSSALFRSVAQRRLSDSFGDIEKYAGTQARVFQNSASEARLAESRDSAVASYADPERSRGHLNTGVFEIMETARREDWAPEVITDRVRTFTSSVNAARIARLADEDVTKASEEFEAVRGGMTADDVSQTERLLRPARLADRARTEADRLWGESGGNLGRFLELARDIDDTEVSDAVVARGKTRFNEAQASKAAATDSAMGRAYTLIERTGSFDGLGAGDRAAITNAGLMDTLRTYEVSRAGGGAGQSTGASRRVLNQIEAISMEPTTQAGLTGNQRFLAIVDTMRGIEVPGVTQQTRDYWKRQRAGMTPGDFNKLVSARLGLTNNDAVEGVYKDLLALASPLARAQGIDPNNAGNGGDNLETVGQWQGFLLGEARAWVAQNPGQSMSAQDAELIATRALAKGRERNEGDWWDGPETWAFMASPDRRVRVPFDKIDVDERLAMARRLARTNPNAGWNERELQRRIEQEYASYLEQQ